MSRLLAYAHAHQGALLLALAQHAALVLAGTAVAILAGVPLGVLAARRPRTGRPVLALAAVLQTIPSLALLGFLIPMPVVGGLGPRAAVVALIVYGLLPVVQTTAAGLRSIDAAILEAATALGMTPAQRLRRVELPLALPSILAGVRVATVTNVGTATIAAAIGAGGLGEYIFRGLSMVDAVVILAGAIPIALLALVLDGLLALAGRALAPARRRGSRRVAQIVLAALFATGGLAWALTGTGPHAVIVGSKNFTEQRILGELLAQTLESAGVPVQRRLELGGTFICDRALASGQIDVYVEYTGTALTAIFKQPAARDPALVRAQVRDGYAATGRTMLPALGFDNTFAILVRARDARARGLRTIADLSRVADEWQVGFGYEFAERADGWPGLVAAYGLRFARPPRTMDLSLTYQALARGDADVIAGDATSGLIAALDLVALEDNRRYFPPYEAVPVAWSATLQRDPRVAQAISRLAGRISVEDMRRMNDAVDRQKQSADAVVAAWRRAQQPGPRSPASTR